MRHYILSLKSSESINLWVALIAIWCYTIYIVNSKLPTWSSDKLNNPITISKTPSLMPPLF